MDQIELIKKLAFQNEEKEKRAAELVIANKELAFQNEEKEKRAEELLMANAALRKALRDMMFMTSHKIRQPIAHILGISNLLDEDLINSIDEFKKMARYIKDSAKSLDNFTREFTTYIYEEEIKLNDKIN